MTQRTRLSLLCAVAGTLAGGAAPAAAAEPVEFNRDIRPILSNNCFACHGPDQNKRKADLRLDTEKGAFADREDHKVLVPGRRDQSELFRRVSDSGRDRMPPAKFGKHLTPRQVELLGRWIDQGAKWQDHWSLLAPTKRPLPRNVGRGQPVNPIDHFILARLEQEGLKPAAEADRRTLARRLAFDLTGLPPTPEEVEAFLADESPDAYAKLVDRYLASAHYGERMALYWLDLVRFADTGGYHSDNHRDIYLFRDYVIKAFNENKPFDRFTIEQLAGDLLPEPTVEQQVASGYNRLLMTTEEGGAQAKEYAAKYSADRVRNVSAVWLGATMGCCECHDHKFDPFTQRDFYSLAAFFADIKEKPVGRQDQTPVPDERLGRELRQLDEAIAALKKRLAAPPAPADQAAWEKQALAGLAAGKIDWRIALPVRLASQGKADLKPQEDLSVLASGKNPARDTYSVTLRTDLKEITGIRLEALTHDSLANRSLSRANGNFVLTRFEVEAGREKEKPQAVPIASAVADYEQPGYPVASVIGDQKGPGWAVDGHTKAQDHQAVFTFARPVPGGPGTVLTVRLKHDSTFAQHVIGRFRLALTTAAKPALTAGGLPEPVVRALRADPAQRSALEKEALERYYRGIAPEYDEPRQQLAALEKQRQAKAGAAPTTLVSMTAPPRVMRILPRGNWMDDSGPVVTPDVPGALPPLGVKDRRATRLDLAHWLVSRQNPVVARVFVNRLWKLMFGQGLVKSLEDFGSQGSWPTQPDLLDWLAVEFMDSGWDVKHLLKLIALSRTYRQSSQAGEPLRQRDPDNQLLARQSRFRLDAEMVRDNALAVSGLLSRKIGGRSVKPYQPAGYWSFLNFPMRTYVEDHGEDQYRRGLYTYWQRTFLHPSLLAFDAPSREECTVDRPRSNTPLQALVLLNDPTYVEAAKALAERIIRSGGDAEQRVRFAYRQVLCRAPLPAEQELLTKLLRQHLDQYQADRKAAEALTGVGDRPPPKDLDAAELAAWTSVARVLLNLHETITRN